MSKPSEFKTAASASSGNFADRLAQTILTTGSYLCAGFDPQPETFPEFLKEEAAAISPTDEEFVYTLLQSFYAVAIDALKGQVAAIKPNIAFFEQYGLGGMLAFAEIIAHARRSGMIVILDAKRGDIGSTAQAYADAFLGTATFLGRKVSGFSVDALTVNPFLGFDTLEPFITRCDEHGKGIFVLVKTSNPGSGDLQGVRSMGREESISVRVARYLAEQADRLKGKSGFSALGAVVGATHPEEARALRAVMPSNLFLIPGYGAQGGTATDAVAGFAGSGGGIINVSRALFGKFPQEVRSRTAVAAELVRRARELNEPVCSALHGS